MPNTETNACFVYADGTAEEKTVGWFQPAHLLAYFEAIEIDAATGSTLSVFRADSEKCALHEAWELIADWIGHEISSSSYFEVRRHATKPADWRS